MKPARNWFILAAACILMGGLAAMLVLQHRRTKEALVAEMETRRFAEEARASAATAAQRAVEVPPTPAVESIPAEIVNESTRKEAGAQALEIQVLDPEGAAVADASIVLFRDEALLAEGTTGQDGRARWPAQEG